MSDADEGSNGRVRLSLTAPVSSYTKWLVTIIAAAVHSEIATKNAHRECTLLGLR